MDTSAMALASRVLMGDSLGFHIIFVLLSLTLPILVCWFELWGIFKNDNQLIQTARTWSKAMAILVVTGVISGTIIAVQMSLVWPGILKFGGEVIGLPFLFETYAFLIEAVFLSLYMYTWGKKYIPQLLHWFFGLMVIVGSSLSAYAITSINGWMNLPTGFSLVNGKITQVSVFDAMFSNVAIVEFVHSMPGYFLTGSLLVASVYAIKMWRAKQANPFDAKIIRALIAFAAIMFVGSAITADITGKYLAQYEPSKLAAIELVYNTQSHAPLLIGGVAKDGQIVAPHIAIPGLLSWLSGGNTDFIVKGLNEFKADQLPPLWVHTLFDIKMTAITVLGVLLLVYLLVRFSWKEALHSKWFYGSIVLSGLLTVMIVELGWMMTEIGRQPWAVRGYVTTAQALTEHDISRFGYIFPALFVVLFIVTAWALSRTMRNRSDN